MSGRTVIIYDTEQTLEDQWKQKLAGDSKTVVMIGDDGTIHHCIGCFGCWIKTPGKCVLKDRYNNIGMLIGNADSVSIVSKCTYGTYSPFIKNVLDRGISDSHPFFTRRDGEIHHVKRYENRPVMNYYIYGECSEDEKTTMLHTIQANIRNLDGITGQIRIAATKEELLDEDCIG